MAEYPDERTIVVDPAGLDHLHHASVRAGGASGAIYTWLAMTRFSPRTRQYARMYTDAVCAQYGSKRVIHAFGVNFAADSWKSSHAHDREMAMSITYYNIFVAYADNPLPKLRLLPICTGKYAYPSYSETEKKLAEMTWRAIFRALFWLPESVFTAIQTAESITMCVYVDKEATIYREVLDQILAYQMVAAETQMFIRSTQYNQLVVTSGGRKAVIKAVTFSMLIECDSPVTDSTRDRWTMPCPLRFWSTMRGDKGRR